MKEAIFDIILGRKFNFIAVATAGSIVAYYTFVASKKPKVHCGNQELAQFLHDELPILRRKYWPAFFYWEGRLQSIFGLRKRLPPSSRLPYTRELVKMRDGGTIGLDYLAAESGSTSLNKNNNNEQPLRVFFMPGLTSSSNASYVKTLVMAITKGGADVIVYNNRGLGNVPTTGSPKTYCATNTDDLEDALAHLKLKYPGEKFFAVGTSFGGIMLSRYFLTQPEAAQDVFSGSLLISTLFDVEGGSQCLESGINLYLNNWVMRDIKRRMKRHRTVFEGLDWFSWDNLMNCQTLRDFDRVMTIGQYGFSSVEEYYAEISPATKLHKLSIPVIALNAEDDPYQPGKCLPIKEIKNPNSKLALVTTRHGGHLGFLTGFLPRSQPFHYMEQFTFELIQALRLQNSYKLFGSI